MLKLETKPHAWERSGDSRAGWYRKEQRGLVPSGVSIGARRVAVPADEVDMVIRARIAGRSDAEVKTLVARMAAAREGLAPDVLRADSAKKP